MKKRITTLNECYNMFEKLGYDVNRKNTLNESPEGDQREFYSDSDELANQQETQPTNVNAENLEISDADAVSVKYDESTHSFNVPLLDMDTQEEYVAIVKCPAAAHRQLSYQIYAENDMTNPIDITSDNTDAWVDMYSKLADYLEDHGFIELVEEGEGINSEEYYVPTAIDGQEEISSQEIGSFADFQVAENETRVTYDPANEFFTGILLSDSQNKYYVDVYCPDESCRYNVSIALYTIDGNLVDGFDDDDDAYSNVYYKVMVYLVHNGYIEYDETNKKFMPTGYRNPNVTEYNNEIEESIVKSVMKGILQEAQYGTEQQAWVLLAHLTEENDSELVEEILENQGDETYLDNLCASFEPADLNPIANPLDYPHGDVLLDNDRYAMLIDNNNGQIEILIFAPYDEYFD